MMFISDARATHIFRKDKGHLEDTFESRQLVLEIASNSAYYDGTDMFQNVWYSKKLTEDTQLWIQVRGEEIWNAGTNSPPRIWNDKTGYSLPYRRK